jgi:pyrrolidone-carboxylate peptidase
MNQGKVTLLAFKNTSAELLVCGMDFPTVFLPSDKIRDSEIAKEEIQKSSIIICFGQKPQIKNKICLELIAKNNGSTIATNFDIESFKEKLEQQNISYSESLNPGTSYCNLVYWNSLNYIKDNNLSCKFLFIHIPFEKNISNISELREKLNCVICKKSREKLIS